ncbi:putative DNA-directed RNA polymerase ii largest subunit [Drepanopeziza brunnea f. sp. 'multigermtubi' MB_m1]|uniref:Putative DNA-directed RNA polymerase ii largest subunit n=1 Tax=Marssonina brunnea f. sp. multigermtubi (strain MB_m1) TaxID=1072389 RepID=K1XIS7_MARBU|nr:putative DNA-directed RNA polymerase ii largest subunit [Drepanopeziza brunnea f. sp. 'multigermtubi' MB_m1]EKD20598.1 putative DNA-directed RNA polymerase ii largest subunit [Drepanopeziza brunnea f. sp. 'multigermtubi' MB_m1]
MDPLSALGAVAAILQLGQTAFTLSKTLYSLNSALSSASEDIQILADDLRTFSQSLTLLSRLLEGSRTWHSDDIYDLTTKIIKDCAELYIKIDKILAKLGAHGKSSWKLKVKFVYKEGDIRKLLKRLRDMKGTLATILMSLQVDLQLSLLNISSPSSFSSNRAQASLETSRLPASVKTPEGAHPAVGSSDLLPKYTATEKPLEIHHSKLALSSTLHEENEFQEACGILSNPAEPMKPTRSVEPALETTSSPVIVAESFMMMTPAESMPSVSSRKAVSRAIEPETRSQNDPPPPEQSIMQVDEVANARTDHASDTRSLKSSSSSESFESARSILDTQLEVARKVKAIQNVLHAFCIALQVLGNLVESRIPEREGSLYSSAMDLEATLDECKNDIDGSHIRHFKEYGHWYIATFTEEHSTKIQSFGTSLMQNVVMKLHEYSAEYEELRPSIFREMSACSANVRQRTISYLDNLGRCAIGPQPKSAYGNIQVSLRKSANTDDVIQVPNPSIHQEPAITTQVSLGQVPRRVSPGFSPTSPLYCSTPPNMGLPTPPGFFPVGPRYGPASPSYSPASSPKLSSTWPNWIPASPKRFPQTLTGFTIETPNGYLTAAASNYEQTAVPARANIAKYHNAGDSAQGSAAHTMDVLRDFDFDSFLREEDGTCSFENGEKKADDLNTDLDVDVSTSKQFATKKPQGDGSTSETIDSPANLNQNSSKVSDSAERMRIPVAYRRAQRGYRKNVLRTLKEVLLDQLQIRLLQVLLGSTKSIKWKYNISIRQLLPQQKKRDLTAAQEYEPRTKSNALTFKHPSTDYPNQPILEQQQKKRRTMTTQGSDQVNESSIAEIPSRFEDYEIHLMLLEQQLKKRHMVGTREQSEVDEENDGPKLLSRSKTSAEDPKHDLESAHVRTLSANDSSASNIPTTLSTTGPPILIHGDIVPLPSWAPPGPGLDPSLEDNPHGTDYELQPRGMESFTSTPGIPKNSEQAPDNTRASWKFDYSKEAYQKRVDLLGKLRYQGNSEADMWDKTHDSTRDRISEEEKIADEAVSVLLKLDPERKSKSPVQILAADKKAVADYQKLLLDRMNCRHNPNRKKMYHIGGDRKLAEDSKEHTLEKRNVSVEFAESEGEFDVLKSFDFDAFMQQNEDVDNFNVKGKVPTDNNNTIKDPESSPNTSPLPGGDISKSKEANKRPLHVNKKQLHRIMKRRLARQQLEQQPASQTLGSDNSDPQIQGRSGDKLSPPRVRFTIPNPDSDGNIDMRDDEHRPPSRSSPFLSEVPKPQTVALNHSRNEEAMSMGNSTSLSARTDIVYPHNLSTVQMSRLWWQTYTAFNTADSRRHAVFTMLKVQLRSELGFHASRYPSDDDICRRIVGKVRPLSIAGSTLHEDRPEMKDVLIIRGEIVRIIMTIDQKLGLQTATLGWSCVWVFLSIFGQPLNHTSRISPEAMSLFLKAFNQLQEIVGIVTRYTVMENLYQQAISSGTQIRLSLKPEYQASLQSLCSSILEWFAASCEVGRIIVDAGDGYWIGADEGAKRCEELMKAIRVKNRECQIFRVEVDAEKEGGESWTESDEMESDDEESGSDGSWQEIDQVGIS